ncbi:MAG: hypothetical protein AAFY56_00615 [Pseudomonadota bacterium]
MTRVQHAQAYPFDQRDTGYIYRDGIVHEGPFELEGRIAVAAAGSNGSPSQLKRKFGECPESIPVTTALIRNHAVVYSAHLTRYGSLPAALWPVAGAIVGVAVTWLNPDQLVQMHETEALGDNYDFAAFASDDAVLEPPAKPTKTHYYRSVRGPLLHQRQPIRLAEIWTGNSALPAMTQPAALRHVHRKLETSLAFDEFLENIITDPAYRRDCIRRMQAFDQSKG